MKYLYDFEEDGKGGAKRGYDMFEHNDCGHVRGVLHVRSPCRSYKRGTGGTLNLELYSTLQRDDLSIWDCNSRSESIRWFIYIFAANAKPNPESIASVQDKTQE